MAASAMSSLALYFALFTTCHSSVIPCAWIEARAGTVRNALFLDGGQFFTNDWVGNGWENIYGSNITYPAAGQVQRFNYSLSFQSSGTAPINISGLLVPMALTAGGSYDAPNYADGAMFVNDYEFYTYGGMPTSQTVSNGQSILKYSLWPVPDQSVFVPGPQTPYYLTAGITNFITHGATACAPSESACYYFSGKHAPGYAGPLLYGSSETDSDGAPDLADTLLTIDMSDSQNAVWHNETLDPKVTPRASGALVWVPVSEKGVLLAIGGVENPIDLNALITTDSSQEALNTDAAFMTSISVYDVATKTWTLQQTFGENPPQLAHFCAVVANATKDSFDIFVYGGGNGVNMGDVDTIAQDQVWVLSVPSFTWVKVGTPTSAHRRSNHVCSMPYPNQMLVVGGWNLAENNYCIQDGTLFDIFDLNTLSWTHSYDPSSYNDYQRPSQIASAVAAQTAAVDSSVASLFAAPYPTQIVSWYPYPKASNQTGFGINGGGGSGTPIGAIVGGVIGGIAVIAIVLLAWFCRPSKRRARKERARKQSEADTETTAQSNSVWPWIRNTPVGMPPPKPSDIISDTATEVDESMSPPMETAEVFGDTYFSPVRRSLMSADGNRRPNRYSSSPVHSPLPPRSPRSMHSSSVEADGEQVHELHNESRNSKVSSELTQAGHTFRNHPLYPHSIDGHLSNGAVASDMSPPSHPSDRLGATSPGPVPSELSEHGDTDTQLTSSVSEHVGSARAVPMSRPEHKRNSSSVSSGVPVTPASITDDSSKRPEMAQQRNSGPISPLLQQEGHRPSHHRHGSSLSEMLLSPTGEPTVPRESDEDAEQTLVNTPTSPSSNMPRRKPLRSAYEATKRNLR